jgi:hypothetical protein
MLWAFALGWRRRRTDKLARAEKGGFVRAGRERNWVLSERCNKMLLKPRTVLGLLFLWEGTVC